MGTRKEFQGAAKATTIVSALTAGSSSLVLTSSTGWPTGITYPWVAVIDRGKSNEEKVLCSVRSGATVTITSRAYDSTSAVAHAAGATVEHCIDSIAMTDALNAGSRDEVKLALVAAQSITNSTYTAVAWDTETSDSANYASGGTITIPSAKDGMFEIGARVVWAGSPSAGEIQVYVNSVKRTAFPTTGTDLVSVCGWSVYLAATDTVQIYVKQTSGGSLNLSSGKMWMKRSME